MLLTNKGGKWYINNIRSKPYIIKRTIFIKKSQKRKTLEKPNKSKQKLEGL